MTHTAQTSIVGAVYGLKLATQLAADGHAHCAAWPGISARAWTRKASTRLDLHVDGGPWRCGTVHRVYIKPSAEGVTRSINRHVTRHLRALRDPLRHAKVALYNLVETREVDTLELPAREQDYDKMTEEDVAFWREFVLRLPKKSVDTVISMN